MVYLYINILARLPNFFFLWGVEQSNRKKEGIWQSAPHWESLSHEMVGKENRVKANDHFAHIKRLLQSRTFFSNRGPFSKAYRIASDRRESTDERTSWARKSEAVVLAESLLTLLRRVEVSRSRASTHSFQGWSTSATPAKHPRATLEQRPLQTRNSEPKPPPRHWAQ